jgi:hypothetical protein
MAGGGIGTTWRSFQRRGQSAPRFSERHGLHRAGINVRHAPRNFLVPRSFHRRIVCLVKAVDKRSCEVSSLRNRQRQSLLQKVCRFSCHTPTIGQKLLAVVAAGFRRRAFLIDGTANAVLTPRPRRTSTPPTSSPVSSASWRSPADRGRSASGREVPSLPRGP